MTFQNPGFVYSLDRIIEFQKDDESDFWSDSLTGDRETFFSTESEP